MKKFLSCVLALVLLVFCVSCMEVDVETFSTEDTESTKSNTKMIMGTGGSAGTYYGFGGVLSSQIKTTSGITVNVVTSGGSKENILKIESGDFQMATVQSDVMTHAWNGTGPFVTEGKIDSFRVIGGLYAEAVQLITLDPSIRSVADLRGKKVSIGAAGSGVYFNAVDILKAAGMSTDDIRPEYLSFADSIDSLKDGKIAASFVVAGAPTPAVQEIFTTSTAYLVPIDGAVAETLMKDSSYYTTYKIPANTYNGQAADVTTVTVKATLIVSASAGEDDVYFITKAIYDNVEAIKAAHVKGGELTLENATEGMTAPFHKGAAKYFAEKGVKVNSK